MVALNTAETVLDQVLVRVLITLKVQANNPDIGVKGTIPGCQGHHFQHVFFVYLTYTKPFGHLVDIIHRYCDGSEEVLLLPHLNGLRPSIDARIGRTLAEIDRVRDLRTPTTTPDCTSIFYNIVKHIHLYNNVKHILFYNIVKHKHIHRVRDDPSSASWPA